MSVRRRVVVPVGGAWFLATEVVDRLRRAGHETYVAGGAVRDLLLGRAVTDVDVATAAEPEAVMALFPRTIAVGRAFGVVVVMGGGGEGVEVATFRGDGRYVDGRRPSEVRFASSREDVERRDVTINALLLDTWEGDVIDHVDGLRDLGAAVLRAVGNPAQRLAEDRLRVLRVLRLASALGFSIEAETWEACRVCGVQGVSRERILAELRKALAGDGARFCQVASGAGRLPEITPGIEPMATARVLARLPAAAGEQTRMAAWLHTLGAAAATRWLEQQPVPAAWRRDIPRLIERAAGLPAQADQVRRRILGEAQGEAVAALARAQHAGLEAAITAWREEEERRGPCPLRAPDVLALGVAPGPEVGRLLRLAEEGWRGGAAGTREELQAWLGRQRHA